MSLEIYAAFVAAVVALMLIPGPNVALIAANAIAHGPRAGLMTVAGTSSAMALQLALVVLGLTGALALLAAWFELLRWAGVAYLVYLGLAAWRAPANGAESVQPDGASAGRLYARGFLVSLTNPKTIFFYAAFLPQFVAGTDGRFAQLLVLAATFLVVAIVIDSGWALFAHRAGRVLNVSRGVLSRLSGGILLAAAAGLALARRG